MSDQEDYIVTNLDDYEIITENDPTNNLDDEFLNSMEIIIAECIGSISKNYSIEHQRLAAYTSYPPMNSKQRRTLAIENITSREVKHQMSEKVYSQLELIFETKIINWNSVEQTTTKRFVGNAVEQAVDTIRGKLLENINNDEQTPNVIVQRFVLVNNHLKIV